MTVRAKNLPPESPASPGRAPAMALRDGGAIKAWRRRLGMNQADFWRPLRVSQPQASRYESGWEMPEPVYLMLNLIYGPEGEAINRLRVLRTEGIDAAIQPLDPVGDAAC